MMRTPILLITVLAQLAVTGQTLDCDGNSLDILLLVDSSDGPANVRSSAFSSEKHFFNTIAGLLFVNDNRFALQTYAHSVTPSFVLGYHKTLTSLQTSGIDNMWLSTGPVNEDLIPKAMSDGFASGKRSTADKVIILLTHNPLSKSSASAVTQKLNDLSAKLVVVFVGTQPLGGFSQLTPAKRVSIIVSPDVASLQSKASHVPATVCSSKTYGTLQPWLSWTACDVTCGDGQRRRFRECRKAQSSDLDCQGPRRETENCHLPECTGRGHLQPWEQWSSCTSTCGPGIARRTRQCSKHIETDEDCEGRLMEVRPCHMSPCTTPVDGGWTYWSAWSVCSKTCDTGVQRRERQCAAPTPKNSGQPCRGLGHQNKTCANWTCPDCHAPCPPGGRRTQDCTTCECSAATLHGIVKSSTNVPLDQVRIFLRSAPYRQAVTTDDVGNYTLYDICMMNETLIFRKKGFADAELVPTQLNDSHWIGHVSMVQYVAPVYTIQPQDKTRIVGQGVSFCCSAHGTPSPTSYIWYKDDKELEGQGQNGTLTLSTVQAADSGVYHCETETDAGLSLSADAKLTVAEGPDTCGRPLANLQPLPEGCSNLVEGKKESTVDTGACPKTPCTTNSQADNGTCTDWWSNCCVADTTESVNVSCGDFAYEMTRIKSCSCDACVVQSSIAGRAYGNAENGTRVSFAYGYIYVNGRKTGVANENGMFRFNVRSKEKRVILHFVDEIFKRFVETSKIVVIQKGFQNTLNVVLPLQPKPITFNPNIGLDVPLGNSSSEPEAGSISIPDNALIDEKGEPFHGNAKAMVHFMDPRKMTGIESANGDFVYEAPDGKTGPLETFGMFHVNVEDHEGKQLKVNKPMTFSLDASLFNVSLDKDGQPDLALWYFDINKGIWVETGKMRFETQYSGRRRLLEQVLVGTWTQMEIPHLDLTEEKPVYGRVITGYTNCDRSVPIYGEGIVGSETRAKSGACYLSVSVYKDQSFSSPADGGIDVTAVTQDIDGRKFIGMDNVRTDENGHACLSIFCDAKIYLYAEDEDGTRLLASKTHDIPTWYAFKNTKSSREVEFEAMNVLDVNTATGKRYSPVVYYGDINQCKANSGDLFRFQFAFPTRPPVLDPIVDSKIHEKSLSWYPVAIDKPTARACFIKVLVKVPNFNVRLIATSHQRSDTTGNTYGTYTVGPVPSQTLNETDTKGACVEYRCSGYVHSPGGPEFNVSTVVVVKLTPTKKCTVRRMKPGLNITPGADGRSFRFVAEPDNDYGPKFGVFVENGDVNKVRSFCSSGSDGNQGEPGMQPTQNPAIEFDCA